MTDYKDIADRIVKQAGDNLVLMIQGREEMKDWQFCAYCGDDLDTGFECNGCGADWMPYAYPWWQRLADKIRALTE